MTCPVCKSEKTIQIGPAFKCQSDNRLISPEYKMLECIDCGIWFKDFPLSASVLEEYYRQLPANEYDWEYSERLPHEILIDKFLGKLPTKANVLDVGCWTGRLLSRHANRLQVFGIEPNKQSAKIAQGRNIELIGEFVQTTNFGTLYFDCITMVDVFEHLPNPKEIIELLIERLKPGGRLIVVTGSTDHFAIKIASSTYWYFSLIPDHLSFINRKHISYLREQNSQVKIHFKSVPHSFFKLKRFAFEILWLLSWRYINPNSPFKKRIPYKIPFLKRLKDVKNIILCLSFNDHYYVEFVKK